jgi:transaldolase
MNPIPRLRTLGQSLWLDNITRDLLNSGTLARYIQDLGVTGLTSNPTIFDNAISRTAFYDEAIAHKAQAGLTAEALFFELALEDLGRAADLFLPTHAATGATDGWVSLEVSPELADDASRTVHAASQLHARAKRANVFIKIPGTTAGLAAIEEAIFCGIPTNVTLLFSAEHYLLAAEAFMRGIERRIAAGLDPNVASVASVFLSRWDVAVKDKVPGEFANRLGIAIALRTYRVYRELLASPRWKKLQAAGARPQRLLWASTGTKDPAAADDLYVAPLIAPDTINTVPEKTLLAFADHGTAGAAMPADGRIGEAELAGFAQHGIDIARLASDLQREGVVAFAKSWAELLKGIAAKSALLEKAGPT